MNEPTDDLMNSSTALDWWSIWSDRLGIAGITLGMLVAVIAGVGWFFSWKSGKLKDEASKRFQQEAEVKIAQAGAAAAEANKIAALANEGQAKAELKLAQLQAKLAPRDISEEQKKSFLETLTSAKIATIRITSAETDPEAMRFAGILISLLRSAGITVIQESGSMILGNSTGITVYTDSKRQDPDGVQILVAAIEKATGSPVLLKREKSGTTHYLDETGNPLINILVGTKPLTE